MSPEATEPALDEAYVLSDDLVDAVLGVIALGQLVERAAPPSRTTTVAPDCAALDALVGLVSFAKTLQAAIHDLAAKREPPPPPIRATSKELRR